MFMLLCVLRLSLYQRKFNLLKKVLRFFGCLFISLVSMLVLTCIYKSIFSEGVFFFNAFVLAVLGAVIGLGVWIIANKNFFENFLIFLVFSMFNTLFIYFGPVTLDRSLSSFIYFYSVQNGSVSRNIFKSEYFEPYVQRRFSDGDKIGYLKCDETCCYPTFKTKLTYRILYPLGKLSNTLNDYKEFKDFYNANINDICPNSQNRVE